MKVNTMKQEITQMSMDDLSGRVDALRKEQLALRLNMPTGQVKDLSQFKKLRKDIARVLTHMRQKGVK